MSQDSKDRGAVSELVAVIKAAVIIILVGFLLLALLFVLPSFFILLAYLLGLLLPALLYREIRKHRLWAAAPRQTAFRWWIWSAYVSMVLMLAGVILAQKYLGWVINENELLAQGFWLWLPPMLVALLPAWLRYRVAVK
ncbi:hypothetical protein [Hymenobacter lapidiphilus]|uniref:Uncharacterized protein n=1 Tax=Hymenobacter lapidiphilus TaxID=2608003 RepID=A0A7Y7PN53_9BACT|nr:hypothetical protein [Hymenobacter lapidiphilus]NVO30896.1 hypothetical protein [Hymenobacter lapidiphilus]